MPQPQSAGLLSKIGTGLLDAAKSKLDATVTQTKQKVAADPVRFGAFVALAANAALGKVGKKMPPLVTNIVSSLVTATVTAVVRSNVKPRPNW